MHTHHAKEQGLMVTSARLLCKMPLLSILLLAVIANGIGHSHRLTQEALILHKEICHSPSPSDCGGSVTQSEHTILENIANLLKSLHKTASVLLEKWLARDPLLLRPGDAQMLCEVLEANFELTTRGQIVSRLQYLEFVYRELVTDILGMTTQRLCTEELREHVSRILGRSNFCNSQIFSGNGTLYP